MDNEVKSFEFPKSSEWGDRKGRPAGVAISFVGSAGADVWIADMDPVGRRGVVWHIPENAPDHHAEACLLPPVPEAREEKTGPTHIALSTDGVVWVCDWSAGVVHVYDPKPGGDLDSMSIDLGEKSGPVDIIWDDWRQLIWVVDSGTNRLVAINPRTRQEEARLSVTHPDAKGGRLAASERGIWFTTGKGTVGLYDFENITEFDLPDADVSKKSWPSALALDGNRLWIMEFHHNELWAIDDITADVGNIMPRKVAQFDKGCYPMHMAVDAAGYLWIPQAGNTGTSSATVLQLTNTGLFVKKYDLGHNKDGYPLGGIACTPASDLVDQIWVSCTPPERGYSIITPIDRIAPVKYNAVLIAASAKTGTSTPGELFSPFTVEVTEAGAPVERHITLMVEPAGMALFPDSDRNFSKDQNDITVRTNAQGQAVVSKLKAATNAAKGEFKILATTRGMKEPVLIYTGHIE